MVSSGLLSQIRELQECSRSFTRAVKHHFAEGCGQKAAQPRTSRGGPQMFTGCCGPATIVAWRQPLSGAGGVPCANLSSSESGSARPFARKRAHAFSRQGCPSLASANPRKQRARGRPDAGCTRSPVCKGSRVESTRVTPQVQPVRPGLPRAMVLTAASCSPRCTGLVSHRRLKIIIDKLDPSVGGTGPHDLAVRFVRRSSGGAKSVHRVPRSTFVTMHTPL
jgi:hypothetical protein